MIRQITRSLNQDLFRDGHIFIGFDDHIESHYSIGSNFSP